jgi:hypothetical protein
MPAVPAPQDAAKSLQSALKLAPSDAKALEAALEEQRAAPSIPAKPLAQSLTARASVAQGLVPIAAYFLAQYLGIDEEHALAIAGALFALLSALAQIGMRRALGMMIIISLISSGCADTTPALRVARQALSTAENDYRTWLLEDELSPIQRAELAESRARTMEAARKAVDEALND